LEKEEEVNDIMFCFLINAGESYIRNKGSHHEWPSNKTFQLMNAYNNLINSYFAIPVKAQLSADTERYLKEFQRCHKECFAMGKGPFPGCNEFCKNKCFFRYDVEPSTKDKAIDEKLLNAIQNDDDSKANVRKLCTNVARNLTIANSNEFVENIALCFFIQKSVQWSIKEVLLNIDKWFVINEQHEGIS